MLDSERGRDTGLMKVVEVIKSMYETESALALEETAYLENRMGKDIKDQVLKSWLIIVYLLWWALWIIGLSNTLFILDYRIKQHTIYIGVVLQRS